MNLIKFNVEKEEKDKKQKIKRKWKKKENACQIKTCIKQFIFLSLFKIVRFLF